MIHLYFFGLSPVTGEKIYQNRFSSKSVYLLLTILQYTENVKSRFETIRAAPVCYSYHVKFTLGITPIKVGKIAVICLALN